MNRGYLVEFTESELDLSRFTALCRAGRAAAQGADWDQASGLLTEALGLWRGAPFADIPSDTLRREMLPPLEQRWLDATQARVEADLYLGRHRDLLPELARLTIKYPLHECFHVQRILALYRCGRRAEALAAYEKVRRVLAAQLGIDPGGGLQELHQRMLRCDASLLSCAGSMRTQTAGRLQSAGPPGPPVVPRQLPGVTRHFVGRQTELNALTRLVAECSGSGAIIAVVTGTAGSGKTTLAIHFARQVAAQFPDGQLYVNLRGFDPADRPMATAEAIRGFLDALSAPGTTTPADVAGQAGLYRSLVATKRMLVVLDNARDAAQVRPLLPGGSGCLVIITSRSQLTSLIATEGAYQLTLGLFSIGEARELIAHCAQAEHAAGERDAGESRAADTLVGLCAQHPLALAVAAARARTRPGSPLAALVEELRDARPLDVLDAGDVASNVRAAFSWSYRTLRPSAARMFRLLGLHPGPDVSAPVAVSLTGVPAHQAQSDLIELVRTHLVSEHAPRRYTIHDLLRAYAAEQAQACETDMERRAAFQRMLDHYTLSGYAAAMQLSPRRSAPVLPAAASCVQPERPAGYAQAMCWLEAEHEVLLAVISQAVKAGLSTHARLLAWSLRTCLDRRLAEIPVVAGR